MPAESPVIVSPLVSAPVHPLMPLSVLVVVLFPVYRARRGDAAAGERADVGERRRRGERQGGGNRAGRRRRRARRRLRRLEVVADRRSLRKLAPLGMPAVCNCHDDEESSHL